MIVIAVYAILTAIATPNWLTYRFNREVGNAAMDVVNTLQNTKLDAVRMSNNAIVALPEISGNVTAIGDTLTGIVFNNRGFPSSNGQVTLTNGTKIKIVTLSTGGSVGIN